MFEKLTGDVEGPVEVHGELEIAGTLRGGAMVFGTLDLTGVVEGPIVVREAGHADIEAVVHGDVHVDGGKLTLRGIIAGRLGATPQADVQLAAGSVVNGRRLQYDGTFAEVDMDIPFGFTDDVTMFRLQPDATWSLVA